MRRLLAVTAAFLFLATVPLVRAVDPPVLPDPKLTPGDVLAVTKQDVCQPGYTRKVRNVPGGVKRQVFAVYSLPWPQAGGWEVDHVIPLECGGGNRLANLFPQKNDLIVNGEQVGAFTKNRLENRLHSLICADKLDLAVAQRAIAANWIEAYKAYVGPLPRSR